MKKLMTLLSAAAVAFGLQAADTGTSFEGMEAGDLDITDSTGELVAESSGYWVTNGSADVTLTIVNDQATRVSRADSPIPQFRNSYQTNYLSLKSTFGNPVTRKVYTGNAGEIIPDTGFYFDSLVKFTAFDEDPMTTAVTNDFDGAKIAVWIKEVSENDVVTGTNLYVRAGYIGGEPRTYNCGTLQKQVSLNGWNRLTIKAIKNIYKSGDAVPGFVVFIDGDPVGSEDSKGIDSSLISDKYEGYNNGGYLFPSMVMSGANAGVLSSVSFDGQGFVDDMVFTETAPDFAKDEEYVYINWTPADIAALEIDNATLTSEQIAAGSYKVPFSDNITVDVVAEYVDGKLAGTWTASGESTVADGTFSFAAADDVGTIVAADAAASFDGISFGSLSGAIAAAKSATVADKVLKIFGATTASDNIDLTGAGVRIKIDLNGCTIGGITSGAGVWVVDSGVGGTVSGEVFVGDGSQIDAGTFEAFVLLGTDSVITGGRFNKDANDIDSLPAAPGYEFVADGDYLVLVPATPKFDFAVTAGDNSYVSEVLIDNVDVTEAVTNGTLEVIASNVAWSVTFTANAGYQFEAGVTTTNFTGTAEAAVAVVGPAASEIPATPSFTVTPGSNSTVTEVLVNGNDVTADVPATLTEGDTWSVTFTADTDYAFDGGATTTNFTGTAAKVAIVVEGPAAAKQQGGWVDPGTIPDNTDAGTQYPELADSDLAETDAKKLTEWAEANKVEISDVAAAVPNSAIYDAYLLGCEPTAAAVAEAKADFVPSISIVDGEVIVTEPDGDYNGRLIKKGSANLEDWYDANTNEGYNFFKYELVP